MNINVPPGRVGIFISGGLDSALLYHLILLNNKTVIPLLVFKNNEQYNRAREVITYLQKCHGTHVEPILLKNKDIRLGVLEAIKMGFSLMFVGVIEEKKEFLVGWAPNNFKDTQWVHGPLKNLDKSQIIDLVIKHNMEHLFLITHSCASQGEGRCNTCNRCRERQWGFESLGLTDPGKL